MEYRFIITGGGTSGHINPALTIADSLTEFYESRGDTCKCIFTGRQDKLEGELVPKAGYEFHHVEAEPFPMKPSAKLIKAIKAMPKGRAKCRKLIEEFKPMAVITTGGYSSVPLMLEAERAHIPTMLHEANAFPGRANKRFGKKAALVMTGFPGIESYFPKAGKTVFTGNPVRSVMFTKEKDACREKLGLAPDDKMVFVMGGSLGSATLTGFVEKALDNGEFNNVKFVLSCGKQHADEFKRLSERYDNLDAREYIDDPGTYLAAADCCVLRAGAVTCAEICATGACAILVPYPFAAHDHQTFNANSIAREGGCLVMSDSDVAEGKLSSVLKELLDDPDRQDRIRAACRKLSTPDTSEKIAMSINEAISPKT
ncbi:MAG: UDP-N-acetylglucosamine--N-acetylmuramyl-(pentapeptide) pyrophosphoryl-undecaprenol N-acetylglucosamine transferase [Clostridiales bacterium]|nr:UDP-N-acetylglucosamine--N-acetylmuramyl-(pentapeptide) pyrophosphoryl-undecaprenol N-acetylglucosamine transferase [Clostridiales bacterium]